SGDFDRDGKEDLAVAGQQSKLVTIHLGNNDGTFPKTKKVSIGKIPVAMAAADFNGDGVLDLATVQFPGHTVTVFPGVGDGTFSRATALKATGGGIGNFDVAVGNFNTNTLTDNKPDLAVPNGKISVFLNTSDFPTAGFHIDVTSPTGASAWTSGAPPPTITWDWSGFGGNVKIEFSANSGDTYKTLVSSVPNTGTANLTKGPTTKTPITTARIRVCSVVFPGICGQSPDFSLTP
ncbi:MAG TPA: VCBS repeat-containing protein, partial [Candidatus Binatia bacterium]